MEPEHWVSSTQTTWIKNKEEWFSKKIKIKINKQRKEKKETCYGKGEILSRQK